MYLKQTPQKNGRIYLSIVDGYYDRQKGYSRQKTVEKLGYLDELKKQYENPIEFFSQRVLQLKKEKAEHKAPISVIFSRQEKISPHISYIKNFGHIILSQIYHDLEINKFIIQRRRSNKQDCDINNILKILVFSRLLSPSNRRKTFLNRNDYFENSNYTLDNVYHCLCFVNNFSSTLQLWINDRTRQLFGFDQSIVYYHVTNYCYKSKKPVEDQFVQMGLIQNKEGIPISYHMYPMDSSDNLTYHANLSNIKKEYNLGKVVMVSDKGIATDDNIWHTLSSNDGYILIMPVHEAGIELKEYVRQGDGYEWIGKEYKRKSRLCSRSLQVTSVTGKKITKNVYEKQVIFYSEKYEKRTRAERLRTVPKTIQTDSNYIMEEQAFDGYYVIITSECKEAEDKIIDMYRGLLRIKDSFRVVNSDLETLPAFLTREEHIKGYFLTCFIALTIARILEMKMEHRYTISQLLESLKKAECTYLKTNTYLFNYYDNILKEIGDKFNIDFSVRVRTLGEIKKILAGTKN